QLLLVALVLIYFLIHVEWPDNPRDASKTSLQPDKPRRKRSTEPKPFTGLLPKPLCDACEQGAAPPKGPGAPPPVLTFTRGRQRPVDTAQHFQIPPDLVVKSQHIDITGVILWPALLPHIVYPRISRGELPLILARWLFTTKSFMQARPAPPPMK